MNTTPPRLGLALAALFLVSGTVRADTIHLLNGKSHDDVTVTSENIKEISYREGSKKAKVRTEDVLRIEFSSKSQLVDRADTAAVDGQYLDAIDDFTLYIEGQLSGGRNPRYRWEPAYAMYRLVELYGIIGEAEPLIAAADQLLQHADDSRFMPNAYLDKAEAQFLTGKAAAAEKTLNEFKAAIQSKGLSQRWQIEHKLASVLFDSKLKGKVLRDKLSVVASEAGGAYPTVKNSAQVAIAESLIGSKKLDDAEPILKRIIDNPKATTRTLAAAYTGYGECLFKRALSESPGTSRDRLLRDAKMAYMRVVVVYKNQVDYRPKAMFWAARVFDESQDEEEKEKDKKLYRKVTREFVGSEWAEAARGFLKR